MKNKIQTLLVVATFSVVGLTAFAENNNDPNRDINATSVGTRLKNAGEPKRNLGFDSNSSIGSRMSNAQDRETFDYDTKFKSPFAPDDTSRAATLESEAPSGTYYDDMQTLTETTAATGLTAQDHSKSMNATELTRKIRRDLMNTDLSTRAKNVTIVTDNGVVTLKGKVPSNSEKTSIEEIAKSAAAGQASVKSELITQE